AAEVQRVAAVRPGGRGADLHPGDVVERDIHALQRPAGGRVGDGAGDGRHLRVELEVDVGGVGPDADVNRRAGGGVAVGAGHMVVELGHVAAGGGGDVVVPRLQAVERREAAVRAGLGEGNELAVRPVDDDPGRLDPAGAIDAEDMTDDPAAFAEREVDVRPDGAARNRDRVTGGDVARGAVDAVEELVEQAGGGVVERAGVERPACVRGDRVGARLVGDAGRDRLAVRVVEHDYGVEER